MINEIIDSGDYITKKFFEPQTHINDRWFKYYSDFEKMYQCVPKIIEYSQHSITMTKLDAITIDDFFWSRNNHLDCQSIIDTTEKVVEVYHHFLSFSSINKISFMHQDIHIRNVMITPENHIYFIDPESIKTNINEFNSFAQFLLKLSTTYSRVHRYSSHYREF